MKKQLTAREVNDKKWEDHWDSLIEFLRVRLDECMFYSNDHALGISRDRAIFQIYGAEESFKFEDNNKVYIKAENRKTGKLVKVYEYLIKEKTIRKCSQAHIIHNNYSEEELKFIQKLKKSLLDYYQPNSIKFIRDIL